MSGTKTAFARGRASLLAGSMLATTVLTGLGGLVGAVALTPGAALAGACAPTTAGLPGGSGTQPNPGPGTNLTASLTEICEGGFPGLGYSTAGNLAVTLSPLSGGGSTVGPNHGVLITSSSLTGNISLVVDTSTAASGAISTTANDGIEMKTGVDGEITINTGNSTNFAGANVAGAVNGIQTEGGANVNITAVGTVTGGTSSFVDHGIFVHDGAGNITVTTAGAVLGGAGVELFGSGAINYSTTANVTGTQSDAIDIGGGAGNVSVTLAGNGTSQVATTDPFGGAGILVTTTTGNVSIITDHGDNVSSTNGDGIDVFSNSGNIFVHLLDGAINANTSGLGPSGSASTRSKRKIAWPPASTCRPAATARSTSSPTTTSITPARATGSTPAPSMATTPSRSTPR
jgi:hypothetical protein